MNDSLRENLAKIFVGLVGFVVTIVGLIFVMAFINGFIISVLWDDCGPWFFPQIKDYQITIWQGYFISLMAGILTQKQACNCISKDKK